MELICIWFPWIAKKPYIQEREASVENSGEEDCAYDTVGVSCIDDKGNIARGHQVEELQSSYYLSSNLFYFSFFLMCKPALILVIKGFIVGAPQFLFNYLVRHSP